MSSEVTSRLVAMVDKDPWKYIALKNLFLSSLDLVYCEVILQLARGKIATSSVIVQLCSVVNVLHIHQLYTDNFWVIK